MGGIAGPHAADLEWAIRQGKGLSPPPEFKTYARWQVGLLMAP
jgi:hypothetical protein